ncbi:BA75_03763T0 [Komagataella pastoris]|uniref:BA75_03763T0 n=1 Tax=Komagataella pastoris TaxID=4922 RepID=A0A1B2JGP2_PICPA|nr:BA75_03763T0 [Komagataella pastoris]
MRSFMRSHKRDSSLGSESGLAPPQIPSRYAELHGEFVPKSSVTAPSSPSSITTEKKSKNPIKVFLKHKRSSSNISPVSPTVKTSHESPHGLPLLGTKLGKLNKQNNSPEGIPKLKASISSDNIRPTIVGTRTYDWGSKPGTSKKNEIKPEIVDRINNEFPRASNDLVENPFWPRYKSMGTIALEPGASKPVIRSEDPNTNDSQFSFDKSSSSIYSSQKEPSKQSAPALNLKVDLFKDEADDDTVPVTPIDQQISSEFYDQPPQHDDDPPSDLSSVSDFSFEENWKSCRNTSIRYYKSKAQLQVEEDKIKSKYEAQLQKNFLGSDFNMEDFQEDFNYDDDDLGDDTEELFNRNLFEDEDENENVPECQDDCKEKWEAVNISQPNIEPPISTSLGRDSPTLEKKPNMDLFGYLDKAEAQAGFQPPPKKDQEIANKNTKEHDHEALNSEPAKGLFDFLQNAEAKQSQERLQTQPSSQSPLPAPVNIQPTSNILSLLAKAENKKEEKLTQEKAKAPPVTIKPNTFLYPGRSIKYHQLSTTEDTSFTSRYSWYPEDDKSEDILQSGQSGVPTSEDLYLDEVNRIPEDINVSECRRSRSFQEVQTPSEFDVKECEGFRRFKSMINKPNKRNGVPILGSVKPRSNRFEQNNKTVTLFHHQVPTLQTIHGLGSDSSSSSRESDDSFKNTNRELVTPIIFNEMPPFLGFKNHPDSPLTTISEGSYDGTQSPLETHISNF